MVRAIECAGGDPMNELYDVVIVGAGVVGAAIARELARYELSCALVEAGPDEGLRVRIISRESPESQSRRTQ